MVFFASELVSRLCQPQLSEVFTRESAAQQFQTVAIKYEKSIISVGKAFLFYSETRQTEHSERIVWFGDHPNRETGDDLQQRENFLKF